MKRSRIGRTTHKTTSTRETALHRRFRSYYKFVNHTRPLVDYYAGWAATGDAAARRYARVVDARTVDEITSRLMGAPGA